MIEAVLRAAGLRTGLYTSPHLLRFTERIRIDGDEIARRRRRGGWPSACRRRPASTTFFEVATAMAFLAFAEAGVDVAVLEVGLGGRLDATNVVERRCARRHREWRSITPRCSGPTLADIAREKAGIFKPRQCRRYSPVDDEAAACCSRKRRGRAARIERFGRDFDDSDLPPLALEGAHQRRNAALARRALELVGVGTRAIARGAGERALAGAARAAVADGAGRCRAQRGGRTRARRGAGPRERGPLVVGVLADKDARAIVAPLVARAARVIVTAPPSPRALPAAELARRSCRGATIAPDLAAALALAAGERVVVAGSIFLVGEARRLVLGEAADPLAVQDPVAQKL